MYGMSRRPFQMQAPRASMRVGGLSGLGSSWYVGTFCNSFSEAVDALGASLAEARRLTLEADPTYVQGYERWERETSLSSWRRTDPLLPSTCVKGTADILALTTALNAKVAAAGGTPSIMPTPPPPGAGELSPTAKFAIIGGIVVVGIIGVAVITGQVAPLLRAVKGR